MDMLVIRVNFLIVNEDIERVSEEWIFGVFVGVEGLGVGGEFVENVVIGVIFFVN